MRTLLAIADDLTGALEAGAKFAARGLPARVTTRHREASIASADIIVIDTESRHLSPQDAAGRTAAIVCRAGPCLIYKKTDSTLRGNIAAELRALAEARPDSRIVYVPAYPAMGRTVRDGALHLDGVPVHRTSFATDPLNPIRDSSISRLLGPELPCTVYDGETDSDVARSIALALADESCTILAGPASVAAELAAHLAVDPAPAPSWPLVRRSLVVNGSRHEASNRQVERALATGCIAEDARSAWQLLRSPANAGVPPLDFATATARAVRDRLCNARFDALLVFGGDTAFAILEELECALVEPLGEVLPGVPLSRIPGRDLYLISKAGGFGGESLICRLRQLLDATGQH